MQSSNNLLDAWAKLALMQEKSINQVFAENLAAAMQRKKLNQVTLAAKSKVSQKTISNCLNPGNRSDTASGKESSVSLTNLQLLADALGAQSWQLLRPIDQRQREIYDKFDELVQMMRVPGCEPASGVTSISEPKKSKARAKTAKQRSPEKITHIAEAA